MKIHNEHYGLFAIAWLHLIDKILFLLSLNLFDQAWYIYTLNYSHIWGLFKSNIPHIWHITYIILIWHPDCVQHASASSTIPHST